MLYNASRVKVIIGIILAILIAAIGWFVYQEDQRELVQEDDIEVNSNPTITATPTDDADAVVIPQNFESYANEFYSIRYHPDMEVRSDEDNSRAFVLLGPSQREGTEVYDGIIFTVIEGTYENQSFKEFVDNEAENVSNDGVSEITGGVISISLGNKTGYEFESSALGDFRHIYFDGGEGKYVYVALLMEDPTGVGFHDTVEEMLQSIEFK